MPDEQKDKVTEAQARALGVTEDEADDASEKIGQAVLDWDEVFRFTRMEDPDQPLFFDGEGNLEFAGKMVAPDGMILTDPDDDPAGEEDPTEDEEQTEVSDDFSANIQERHDKMRATLNRAVVDKDWWQETLSHPGMSSLLAQFEMEANAKKEALVDEEQTAAFKKLQAEIKARVALLHRIRMNATDEGVDAAQRELETFERENGLFITPGEDVPEAEETDAGGNAEE